MTDTTWICLRMLTWVRWWGERVKTTVLSANYWPELAVKIDDIGNTIFCYLNLMFVRPVVVF